MTTIMKRFILAASSASACGVSLAADEVKYEVFDLEEYKKAVSCY